MCFCCAAENSTGRVLEAREVELPIMSYDGHCGLYSNATVQSGMICAGYSEGNRDTCQVPCRARATQLPFRWNFYGGRRCPVSAMAHLRFYQNNARYRITKSSPSAPFKGWGRCVAPFTLRIIRNNDNNFSNTNNSVGLSWACWWRVCVVWVMSIHSFHLFAWSNSWQIATTNNNNNTIIYT